MKNSNIISHLNELSLLEKVEVIWVILVASSTGHVEMRTRVRILTCLVELATGHKPLQTYTK